MCVSNISDNDIELTSQSSRLLQDDALCTAALSDAAVAIACCNLYDSKMSSYIGDCCTAEEIAQLLVALLEIQVCRWKVSPA